MNEFKVIEMIDSLLQAVKAVIDDLPYMNKQEIRVGMKRLRHRVQAIKQACEEKKEENS